MHSPYVVERELRMQMDCKCQTTDMTCTSDLEVHRFCLVFKINVQDIIGEIDESISLISWILRHIK